MTAALKKGDPRAVADLAEGLIVGTVEIAAPPERVFRALASDEVTRWWGSADTYRTTRFQADLRVGGAWLSEGVGADGHTFSVGGEFLEVDPPRRLAQTWRASWEGGVVTTVRYRLEPIAGGTRLTIRHEGFGDRRQACQDHAIGWERVLGWLRGHLEEVAS
jgi:uncharacterized protein YndB with AHSA1/START domain